LNTGSIIKGAPQCASGLAQECGYESSSRQCTKLTKSKLQILFKYYLANALAKGPTQTTTNSKGGGVLQQRVRQKTIKRRKNDNIKNG